MFCWAFLAPIGTTKKMVRIVRVPVGPLAGRASPVFSKRKDRP
jgi:hypothetical protein